MNEKVLSQLSCWQHSIICKIQIYFIPSIYFLLFANNFIVHEQLYAAIPTKRKNELELNNYKKDYHSFEISLLYWQR